MELTQEQSKQLKTIELGLFRAFLQVCDTLNLRYYVLGGTLLGAVRHQGFIPWDDDIDVGMPRKDYEIFIAKAQALLPDNVFLQTFETDPEYPANFAKLRQSNTTYIETSVAHRKMNHGVFFDIFPLDYYPEKGTRGFALKSLLLKLRISDAFKKAPMKLKTRLVRAASRLIYPSVSKAIRKREMLFRSVKEGKRMVNHCGAWREKEIVPADWFGEGTSLLFEGITVSAPSEYKLWLTQVYGDYMQLPPMEKRKAHHDLYAMDLNKSYLYYVQR